MLPCSVTFCSSSMKLVMRSLGCANRGFGGSAGGCARAGKSRERNEKRIVKARNENARPCRNAASGRDIRPPRRDAALRVHRRGGGRSEERRVGKEGRSR